MNRVVTPRAKTGKGRPDSFSLVELLVVIAIIAILTAITLQAVSSVLAIAARSSAKSQIKAMESALESYKLDNGAYPVVSTMATNQYTAYDGTTTNYTYASEVLYQALSGKTNYFDIPVAGVKAYENFKISQLGNGKATAGSTPPSSTYVQDPWSFAYGYSTGTTTGSTNYPYNGLGFFDLWSTGGLSSASAHNAFTNTAAWLCNWQ